MEKRVYEGIVKNVWVGEGFGIHGSGRDFQLMGTQSTDMLDIAEKVGELKGERVRITIEVMKEERGEPLSED